MHHATPGDGACVEIGRIATVFGETKRSLLNTRTPYNPDHLRVCRAIQSPETKRLIAERLVALYATAGSNVVLLGGAT